MDRIQLEERLISLGVTRDAYSLDGGLPNERYVLEGLSSDRWRVYYSEKGLRSGLKEFETEAEACDFILATIKHDLGL